ncbi:MAG: hypothetical protein U1F43_28235 [Myxococcota bacterium]
MKRALSTLFAAGIVALPAAASADSWVVRQDGIRFDSDVGAACGALNTDIFFQPGETTLDIHDQSPLDYLAKCFTSGELAGAQIGVVGYYDGSDTGAMVASGRERSIIDYLVAHGVSRQQLNAWWQPSADADAASDGRVGFKLITPGPTGWWWVIR